MEQSTNHSWPHDLVHEFFAVFLGVWASFMLTQTNFSLAFGAAVLGVSIFPVYRLVNAFMVSGKISMKARWLFYHGPTLLLVLIAVPAIYGLAEIIIADPKARPPLSQVAFLAVIIVFWILFTEAGFIRLDEKRKAEAEAWNQT